MTYQEAHTRANTALVRYSEEVFVHLPGQLDDMLLSVLQRLMATSPMSRPAQVALMGVLRLKQEAHAVRALLGLGYPVQGVALAANMVEFAFDLLYVRDDEARARAWEEHGTLEDNVWSGQAGIRRRMRDGLTALRLSQQEIDQAVQDDYGLYGLLCAAKHGNPLMQKMVGGTFHGDSFVAGPQEYTVDMERRSAALAMHAVVRTTTLAALVVLEYHAPVGERSELQGKVSRLRERARLALNALAT